jgi:hypothetical protein
MNGPVLMVEERGAADRPINLMDPDSDQDPAIFVIDLQDVNKKLI